MVKYMILNTVLPVSVSSSTSKSCQLVIFSSLSASRWLYNFVFFPEYLLKSLYQKLPGISLIPTPSAETC